MHGHRKCYICDKELFYRNIYLAWQSKDGPWLRMHSGNLTVKELPLHNLMVNEKKKRKNRNISISTFIFAFYVVNIVFVFFVSSLKF